MRIIITFMLMISLTMNLVYGQAPKSFKYQAIVRDAGGIVITTHNVSLQINIIQDTSVGGTIMYCENFVNIKPSSIGMVNIDIGKGTRISGNFNSIDWGNHKYYLQVNMDPIGGSNFSPMGITELMSVPYALYAATAGNSGSSNINLTGTGSTTVTGTSPNYNINGSYQYLRSSNDTIYLTNGGFVKLPYKAGTGIGITGTNIVNIAPNTTHTGDATGSSTLTVVALQGNPVTSTTPSLNQVLSWNGGSWVPSTLNTNNYYAGAGVSMIGSTFINSSPNITHSGDAVGSGILTVVGLQGNPILSGTPNTNQVLSWNGSAWAPTSNSGLPYYAGTGLSITGNTFYHLSHTGDASGQTNLTVIGLRGNPISTISPTTNQVLSWNGSAWAPTNCGGTHYIGQLYGGGIVYWVDNTGSHGNIVSLVDVSTGDAWSNITSTLIGTTAQSVWDGKSNTTAIMSQSGYLGGAATDCHSYTNANYGTGVYTDWYLPAIDELNLIYNSRFILNKTLSLITGANPIPLNMYWSSTEYLYNQAMCWAMLGGGETLNPKGSSIYYVRAVRTF